MTENRCERLPDPNLTGTYAPNPTTSRGQSTNLKTDKTGSRLLYPCGKLVIVREIANPNECLVYRGHNAPVTCAAFAPNGFWIASGDTSGKVRVWAYDNPEHILKLELNAFAGEIRDLVWDSDSRRIICVGDGREVQARAFMWDSGNSVGDIVGHTKRILSVDYKPTRPFRAVTCAEDFNVCFFAGPPFKFQTKTSNHTNFVNCVRYSPDGNTFVSCGSDKKVIIYDGKTGEVTGELPVEHKGSVYSCCWSPDSSQLLTASADKTVKLWDMAARSCITTFTFGTQVGDMQVSVVWAGSTMISLSLDGTLNYLNPADAAHPTVQIMGHQVSITSLALGVNNSLITSSYDGAVFVRQPGMQPAGIGGKGHGKKVSCVAGASAGGPLVSVGWDDHLRWALQEGVLEYKGATKLNGQPVSVVLGPQDPTLMLVAGTKGTIVLKDGHVKFQCKEPMWTATCIDVTPDQSLIAVGGKEDMKVHLFRINPDLSLTEEGEISGHRGAITCLSFSPDGSQLAVGDSLRDIRVWDVASRTAIVEGMWVYHSTSISCVTWAPSGRYVASGSLDEAIYVWTVPGQGEGTAIAGRKGSVSGDRQSFLNVHQDGVTGLRFTDENTLVSVGNDGVVNTWMITH